MKIDLDSIVWNISNDKSEKIDEGFSAAKNKACENPAYKKIAADIASLEKKRDEIVDLATKVFSDKKKALSDDEIELKIQLVSVDKKDYAKLLSDFKAKKY